MLLIAMAQSLASAQRATASQASEKRIAIAAVHQAKEVTHTVIVSINQICELDQVETSCQQMEVSADPTLAAAARLAFLPNSSRHLQAIDCAVNHRVHHRDE